MRTMVTVLLCGAISAAVLVPTAAAATGGEGEAWPSFTESSSCGAQRISTPHAARTGGLGRDTLLRGSYGAMFGRTVQAVHDALVRWEMPGSSEVLAVHPLVVPALEEAAADLERQLASGATYRIDNDSTFSTASRTIGGQLRISRHTYGIAFDVNAGRNPYRGDNRLITDLPEWWIDSFLDAGFCWGGLWIGSKDAMHFAWQGPAFSGYDAIPAPLPPVTDAAAFGNVDAAVSVVPRPLAGTIGTVLTDADGNGESTDVVRIVVDGSDVVVDASVASRQHNACSARRSIVSGLGPIAERAVASGFGDWDGRGGQDLWFASDDDGSLRLTVRWAFGGYAAETSAVTDIPTPSAEAWISTADADVDGRLDLVVIDGGTIRIWAVDPDTGASSIVLTAPDPFPDAEHRMIGDRDLDNRPDLWAIVDDRVVYATAAGGFAASAIRERPLGLPDDIVDVVVADYDGDGRGDLVVFDGEAKRVWLGNTRLPDGLPLEVWFEYEEPDCGERELTWDREELRFSSSGWVAVGSYEWRSMHGLPTGCDPEDEACIPEPVTRRHFAEFLAWIAGVPPASASAEVAAARAVAIAGYDLPCALSDDACWDTRMLRAELAAYFGMFLADRRGDVPPPHRWVIPVPTPDRDHTMPE